MVLADRLNWYLVNFSEVVCQSVLHSRIIWNVAVFRYKTYYLFGVEKTDYATTFSVLEFIKGYRGTPLLVDYTALDHKCLIGCMVYGLVFDMVTYISTPIMDTKISTAEVNCSLLGSRKCCVGDELYDFYPIKCSEYKREIYNLPIMVICDDRSKCYNPLCQKTKRYEGAIDGTASIYDLVFKMESCFRNVDYNVEYYKKIIADENGMYYTVYNQHVEKVTFPDIKYFTCSYIFSSLENVNGTGVDELPIFTKKLSFICSEMLTMPKNSLLKEFKELLTMIIDSKEYNENDFSSTQVIKKINQYIRTHRDGSVRDDQNMHLNEQRLSWIELGNGSYKINPLIPTVHVDSYFGFINKYRVEVEQMLKECNGDDFKIVYCISPDLDLAKLKFISSTLWNNYSGNLRGEIINNSVNVCTKTVAKYLAYEFDQRKIFYQVIECPGARDTTNFSDSDFNCMKLVDEKKYDCRLIVCNCKRTAYINRISRVSRLYTSRKSGTKKLVGDNGFNFCFTDDEPTFSWMQNPTQNFESIIYNLRSRAKAPQLHHPGYKLLVQTQSFAVEIATYILATELFAHKREDVKMFIEQFLKDNNHHENCDKIKNAMDNVYISTCAYSNS